MEIIIAFIMETKSLIKTLVECPCPVDADLDGPHDTD